MTDVADRTDPAHWSATRIAAAIRRRELSSVEVTRCYLDRIASSGINAVVTVDGDRALRDARAADVRTLSGVDLPALHGVPMTVKDAIWTEGMRTTGGAPELADHVPGRDAPAVARLRAAGAVLLGKTNLPTWCADIQTYNPLFGTTVNPWHHDYSPGGSSGGSAAAVAAGLTGFDLGSDIGGSVRIPAHLCGVYGLKPTFGLVPAAGYADHVGRGLLQTDLNVFGPLTRSPEDLLPLLDVLRSDPAARPGWHSTLAPVPSRPLRVGTWFADPFCGLDAEYAAMLEAFADSLTAHDVARVATRPATDLRAQRQLYLDLGFGAIAYNMPQDWQAGPAGRHSTWLDRHERRLELRDRWSEWFADVDALLCPVLAVPSLRIDESGSYHTRTSPVNGRVHGHHDIVAWCGVVTVLGLPSVVVPIGVTDAGLPAGVQIVSDLFHDTVAIELACRAGGRHRVPPSW